MINISSTLKERLKHDYAPYNDNPVHKDLTMSFTNPVLTIDNSMRKADTFSLDQCICDSETIQFGGCKSSVLRFVACGIPDSLKGRECTVELTIENETIQLGTYIVDSVEQTADENFKGIIAYDRMKKFDTNVADWYNSFPWANNKTLNDLRNSLCYYIGVDQESITLVNDNMPVEKTISAESINGIDVLRSICELNGVFGRVNELGILTYVSLDNTVTETLDDYRTLTYDECSIDAIGKLQIRSDENDIGAIVGVGTNCYVIQGNILVAGKSDTELQTIATNLSSKILGLTYRPFEYDGYGLPFLQIGDSVQFNGYTSYIFKRTLSGVQCLKDLYSTKGTKQVETQNGVNVDIKQLKSKTNILVRTVEEMTSKISEKIGEDFLGIFPSTSIFPSEERFPCENTQYTLMLQEFTTQIQQTSREIVLATSELENELENKTATLRIKSDQIESTVSDLSNNTSTSISQLSNQVNIKVNKDDVCNQINIAQEGISLRGNRVEIESTNFSLDREGNVECKNGKFSGNVGSNGLFSGDGRGNSVLIKDGMVSAKTEYQSDWNAFFSGTECYAPKLSCDTLSFGNTTYSDTTLLTTSNYSSYLNSSYASSGHTHTEYASSGHTHTQYATNYHDHYSTEVIAIDTGHGNISFGGSLNGASVTYVQENFQRISSSDARLKYDIMSIEAEKNIQDFYMKLKCKSYKFKDSKVDKNTHFGLLAQEVKKSIDECCLQDDWNIVEEYEVRKYMDEGMYVRDNTALRVNYEELHALHITMIQKQQREIEELKELVNNLLEKGRD